MMKFASEVVPNLPRLAWAACLDLGQETVRVIHGSAVECRDQWLVEGTWDGDFEEAGFARSLSFFGSGIRIEGDRIVFVPSAALVDRLLYCVDGRRLFVSNSLVLLLAITGARLADGHSYHKESNAVLKGYRAYDSAFTVSHPRIPSFFQIYHNNIVVSRSGDVSIDPKPWSAVPLDSFADYHGRMKETLRAIHANYTDPRRSVRLDAFSTISTGYDSSAVSALVRAIGVTKCFNSRRSNSTLPPWLFGDMSLDDATPIAQTLRMEVLPLDSRVSLGDDELYFYAAGSAGAETIFSSMAGHISKHCQAALVFTGHLGGIMWGKRLDPPDVNGDIKRGDMSGQLLSEVRLKSGFIHAPVPFILATETESVHRITNSREMEPWRLGNNYDRPIPRRILEQEGVAREWFGQQKKAVWIQPFLPEHPALRKRFLRFLGAMGIRHVRACARINRLYYVFFRALAYLRQFARARSLTLDPHFANLLRTRQRLFHKKVDFTHLLHLFAVDQLAPQLEEVLRNSGVDGRWRAGRPEPSDAEPPAWFSARRRPGRG